MGVGLPRRRPPYAPPTFFGDENDYAAKPAGQFTGGFSDVLGGGVGGDPTAFVEQAPQAIEQGVQLINPIGPDQAAAPQTPGAPVDDFPSEASIERRMKLAKAMMEKQQEVNHPMQAVANAVSQIGGAYLEGKAAKDQEKIEQRRRDAYKKALGGGGDLNGIADQMMASDDPAVVEKGLELKLQIAMAAGKRSGGKPTQMIKGDDIVYVDEDGNEIEGYGGPRYRPQGADGGARDYQKNNMVLKPGESSPRPARFNPKNGPEYLDSDGKWKPITSDMVEVTPSTVAPVSKEEVAKLDNEIMDLQSSIQYFEDYANTRGGARQGVAFAADNIIANTKTMFGGELTPEQIATLRSKGEFSSILGLFRTAVLGPGPMTQADREFLEEALGKYPSAFQNKEVLQMIIDQWVARRRQRLEQLQTRRQSYTSTGTSAGMPAPEAPLPRDSAEKKPQRGSTPLPQGVPPKDKRPKGFRVKKGDKWYEWNGSGWREAA